MAQPQPKSMLERLADASADLDELMRDMQLGRPSQARHDAFVDRAREIAAAIDATTRAGPVGQVNPPLAIVNDPDTGKPRGAWW